MRMIGCVVSCDLFHTQKFLNSKHFDDVFFSFHLGHLAQQLSKKRKKMRLDYFELSFGQHYDDDST